MAKKKKKQELEDGQEMDFEEEGEEGGGKLIIAIVTVVIIIIWLAIFALLIKLDVGGFGSTVLSPILKNVPYINKILPSDSTASGDASEYGYSSLAEAIEQIKLLESELDSANATNSDLESQIAALQAEVSRLSVYESEQAEFEELRAQFYEEVIFSDEAPDIEEYQKYYESIDEENAAALYKQVIQQEETDEEVEDYAATYSSMKPANAASLMEEMTDNLDLVAKILENMDTESRAAILDAMDAEFAATITKLMAPDE